MQTISACDHMTADLKAAYQDLKNMASRLKRAFDRVEDEAIINGKAIPLARLLHSILRSQLQLAEKIDRRLKSEKVSGPLADERNPVNETASPRLVQPSSQERTNDGVSERSQLALPDATQTGESHPRIETAPCIPSTQSNLTQSNLTQSNLTLSNLTLTHLNRRARRRL